MGTSHSSILSSCYQKSSSCSREIPFSSFVDECESNINESTGEISNPCILSINDILKETNINDKLINLYDGSSHSDSNESVLTVISPTKNRKAKKKKTPEPLTTTTSIPIMDNSSLEKPVKLFQIQQSMKIESPLEITQNPSQDSEIESQLSMIIKDGDEDDLISYFDDNHFQLSTFPMMTGISPLNLAIKYLNIPLISFLVNTEFNINWKDENGDSALSLALATQNKDIITIILRGVNQDNLETPLSPYSSISLRERTRSMSDLSSLNSYGYGFFPYEDGSFDPSLFSHNNDQVSIDVKPLTEFDEESNIQNNQLNKFSHSNRFEQIDATSKAFQERKKKFIPRPFRKAARNIFKALHLTTPTNESKEQTELIN